jgi:GNAT superfamily N-acetyltransferase
MAPDAPRMSAPPEIRRELRPGDYGAIVAQHGRVYAREYGLDASFEASVASAVARAATAGWPGAREGIWIIEQGGRFAGSLGLTDEGEGEAALHWFLLDASLRGHGLGRRLVGELVEKAEEMGYARIGLETFSELEAAGRIYRDHGFRLVGAEVGPRWGRAELTYQRYELELAATGIGPSSPGSTIAA